MRVHAKILAAVLACGLAGSMAALGCGSKSQGALDPVGGGTASSDGGDDASAGDPSTGASDDGGAAPGIFTSGDASGLAPGVAFDCQPGTYAGTFTTKVTSDAGGLLSLFSFSWMGNLSITLQGQVTQSGGGEIPLPTLTIAPGAKLAGTDAMNGHFSGDLSGQLDCPSKTLTATIANGSYNYLPGDAGGISMQGTMSATYDGTGATPALTNGAMNVSSAQIAGIAAVGAWTATLQ
jgi:hypothetical protein